MATNDDMARLAIQIEANTRGINKQLAELAKRAADSAAGIENNFKKANDNIAGSFARGGKQVERSLGAQRAAAQNLSFQLNDIATSLAGGASPFQVMMQQGSQVTQVLNGAGGVNGAVQTLGTAFASMVNPVALATFAMIGLGGAAVQYFATMLTESDQSEEVLRRQATLIQQVADRWGDAIPALREYADELKRAQEAADLDAGIKIINDKDLAATRAQIEEAQGLIGALVVDLQQAGEESESILALQRAFNDFTQAANEGKLSTEDVERVQDALSTAISSTGIPALADFASMFRELSSAALVAAADVQGTISAVRQAQSIMNDPRTWRSHGRTDQNADGTIQGIGTNLPDTGPTPEGRPLIELAGSDEGRNGTGRRKGRTGGTAGRSEAEREAEAIAKLISNLEHERNQIGMTDEQRRISNALRQAGSSATDEQKQQITGLIQQIMAETAAIRQNEEAMRALQDIGRDVLGGFIRDLRTGKSASEALAGALQKVADRLLDISLDSVLGGGGGKGGGGIFGSLFSGLFGGGFNPIGKIGLFANGVANTGGARGQPRGVVHGQEAVIPLPMGGKVPVQLQAPQVARTSSSSGRMKIDVGVSVDNNGNLQAFVRRASRSEAAAEVDSYDRKRAPGTAVKAVQQYQMRHQ